MPLSLLKKIYYAAAGLWTLVCLYGIYDTAINPTDPLQYGLPPLKMGFGFALMALLGWLPWLIVWLRRKNPKTATLEQTFERVRREFDSANHPPTPKRHNREDEEDA